MALTALATLSVPGVSRFVEINGQIDIKAVSQGGLRIVFHVRRVAQALTIAQAVQIAGARHTAAHALGLSRSW
jgi:hypothetical protein